MWSAFSCWLNPVCSTIDLNEMTGVQEHTPDSQSDATQACFKVVTKSRTYELMAKDRDAMTK